VKEEGYMEMYYRRVKQSDHSLIKGSVKKIKRYGGVGRSYGGAERSSRERPSNPNWVVVSANSKQMRNISFLMCLFEY